MASSHRVMHFLQKLFLHFEQQRGYLRVCIQMQHLKSSSDCPVALFASAFAVVLGGPLLSSTI